MAMKLSNSLLLVSASLLATATGRTFLNHGGSDRIMSAEQVKQTLLDEIQNHYAVDRRGLFARLESTLKPLFDSLPKNQHGNLGHTTVRYAVHRLFVQRHGLYIKGLEPDGDAWNSTSPSGILKDRVSSYVEDLFEERLGGRGFSLHDTAVFAATLEHLIHDDNMNRLAKVYESKNLSFSTDLTPAEADSVLDHYMILHVLSEEVSHMVSSKEMGSIFPGWSDTQQFVRDIRSEIERTSTTGTLSFDTMKRVVEEVGDRFGHFQDGECRAMKTRLISMGDGGIGRVPLSEFYKTSIDGAFEFQESESYLRDLGALDDTDPSHPSVIIPNYLQSASNCVASASLYSVCCLNECEQLMGHLEREISAPEAEPSRIAAIVADLPSATVEAPRTLSPALLGRLDEAAAHHGGTVQLHGRLFGQWMHHAFPRECPFPHVAGTTNPSTPDEWMAESPGMKSRASNEEMRRYAEIEKPNMEQAEVRELHWTMEEELLAPLTVKDARSRKAPFFLVVVMLSALVSVAFQALAPVKVAQSPFAGGMKHEKMV